MRKYKISEAIGNISSRYIEEAATYDVEEKSSRRGAILFKCLSLAACFCLIVTAIFTAIDTGLFDSKGGFDGGADADDLPENNGNPPNIENPKFSIANGALYLEIYDSYIIEGKADVIAVYLSECGGQSEIFFRSSGKIENQHIRRIETADGKQVAAEDSGVFEFKFTEGQSFVFLNIYFDEGTFLRGVENDESGGDILTDDEKNTNVFFECSAISRDGGYDEIVFTAPISSISDEAKLTVSGTALTLEEALNTVDFKQLFVFDDYMPTGITYFSSSRLCEVAYSYGINKRVSIRASEYHEEGDTIDSFVETLGYFDEYLYPLNSRGVTRSGYNYNVYSCFKNEHDFKSEIVVLEYKTDGSTVFFYIQFDLYGENAKHDVKTLIEQMKLVDITDLR